MQIDIKLGCMGYILFWFSDGRSVREFLKKCDNTNLIVICEPDIELFAMNCHFLI